MWIKKIYYSKKDDDDIIDNINCDNDNICRRNDV